MSVRQRRKRLIQNWWILLEQIRYYFSTLLWIYMLYVLYYFLLQQFKQGLFGFQHYHVLISISNFHTQLCHHTLEVIIKLLSQLFVIVCHHFGVFPSNLSDWIIYHSYCFQIFRSQVYHVIFLLLYSVLRCLCEVLRLRIVMRFFLNFIEHWSMSIVVIFLIFFKRFFFYWGMRLLWRVIICLWFF